MTGGRRRGGSLVEVVVALVILSVATAATCAMVVTAASRGGEADRHERLLWAATAAADSLAEVAEFAPGILRLPDGSVVAWVHDGGDPWVEARPGDRDSTWLRIPVAVRGGRTTLGERP